ncbi:MAG TPA: YaaL family protein [Firmicutes bacterium]|jgi:hypothetical protein|nr:YaaL family protein [Bacillota bacterium]
MASVDWRSWWRVFANSIVPAEQIVTDDIPSLATAVEQARQEWLSSQSYFQNVSDPELVDHAIHMMKAAERKYMYLLRQAQLERRPI